MQLPSRQSLPALPAGLVFLVCILFAGLARLLNANIGYANEFNCDSWYFFGLQFNFRELYDLRRFYQTFRFPALVPWIFLGDRIPYETLNAIRFFTYLAITCAGFLWFNTRMFGPKVAALVTVLFCCSTGFLGVLSNDYVTAAGVAWTSLFAGSTVEAGHSRHPLAWGIAAGILFGMCFYTHIPIVFFVFTIPLLYFTASEHEVNINGFARYAAGCAAGFVLMSAVCGLYNWSLGGSWFFLGAEIRISILLARDAAASAMDRVAGFGWLTREATVVSMELGVIAAIAVILINLRDSNTRTSNLVSAVYLLPAAVTMGWEASGRIILQNNVYAPWIYPTLFAVFGAALSRLRAVREISWPALTGTVLVLAGTLLLAARTDVSAVPPDRLFVLKVVFGSAFAVSLLALYPWRAGIIAALALALFVAVSYPTGYGRFPWVASGHQGRDMALQAAQALRRLDELHLTEIPAFWIKGSPPETIAVPRSFFHCAGFGASFPSLAPGAGFESYFSAVTAGMVGSARTLVVIAPGENLAAVAAPRLRRIGFESTSLGEWHIGSGELRNTMAVLRTAPGASVTEAATAVYMGTDAATQGSWRGRYGHSGYAVVSDATNYPSDAEVTVTGGTAVTWQAATNDNRALQLPTGAGRLAAAWYTDSLMTIEVNLGDGALHQVALYAVDWDTTAREERIDVLDAITGTLLDTRSLSGFNRGQYVVWTVRGQVRFVVTRRAAANAVISGVFLDPAVPEQRGPSTK
jgi:hypothetical protein